MKNEVLENVEISKTPQGPGGKLDIFSKSIIFRIILVILSFLVSFFVQSYFYKPNMGTIIDSDMDSLGNIYILSVIERNNKYKITKVSDKG